MNGVGEVAEEGLNQSLPSSTSDSENNSYCYFVGVMEIIEKQEIGKFILGLVIPMVMALVFSVSHVATSPEMVGACIALCIAFAAIWNAILLAKIFPTPSIIILILGICLMLSAFFAFLASFLPLFLKWIPALCLLATLFPLLMFLRAFLITCPNHPALTPQHNHYVKTDEEEERV